MVSLSRDPFYEILSLCSFILFFVCSIIFAFVFSFDKHHGLENTLIIENLLLWSLRKLERQYPVFQITAQICTESSARRREKSRKFLKNYVDYSNPTIN